MLSGTPMAIAAAVCGLLLATVSALTLFLLHTDSPVVFTAGTHC